MTIKFGTDGWRAIIADDYTFENLKICSKAAALYLIDPGRKNLPVYELSGGSFYQSADRGVIIGYDSRFLSDKFAKTAAQVLSSYNIPVFLSDQICPTPAVSWAIIQKRCAGGVVITASHNPPEYNGFKFKAEYGGSGLPEIICAIEEKLNAENNSCNAPRTDLINSLDLITPYLKQLKNFVDFERIARQKITVTIDSMYGAASNLFESLFIGKKNIKIIPIRNTKNPGFDGISPEPLDKNLQSLKEAVKKTKSKIGFAFDGDGDRIGGYDKFGNFLSSHHIFLMLLWHLIKNRKMTGSVVKTFSTTEKVRILTEKLGTQFIETPIGFKYICQLMLKDDILIGGEESGGIGIKGHMPERDGMLCALLILEAMAYSKMEPHKIMEKIYSLTGKFFYDRVDIKLKDFASVEKITETLRNNLPKIFGKIKDIKTLDGVKYLFKDSSWILFRPSGTEPLLRVYAETGNPKKTQSLLNAGVKYVHNFT